MENLDTVGYTAQHLLDSLGFRVTRVNDGMAGLEAVLRQDFDVILCDLIMPKLSGDLFYLAVRRTRPHLCARFLFTTGLRADRKIEAFIRVVSGLILCKPFTLGELDAAISTIPDRSSSPC